VISPAIFVLVVLAVLYVLGSAFLPYSLR